MIMMNHMKILNVMMITYSDAVDNDDDDDAVMMSHSGSGSCPKTPTAMRSKSAL